MKLFFRKKNRYWNAWQTTAMGQSYWLRWIKDLQSLRCGTYGRTSK